MPRDLVQIEVTQDIGFAADLETDLLHELRKKSPQAVNASFSLRLRDGDGQTLGGVTASSSYGWLLIKVLFVSPSARRCGHGRALLERALQHARSLCCHSAWLDTSDADAYQFYLSMGFEEFGTLSNACSQLPYGHSRWFLKTAIS